MADGNETGTDNAIGMAILFVVFTCIALIIWYFNKESIRDLIRWIRYYEMVAISPIPLDFAMREDFIYEGRRFGTWLETTPTIPKAILTNNMVGEISDRALRPYLWPISSILVFFGLWSLFKGPKTHYRRTHTLDSLIEFQSKTFPYISPVVDFNPAKQDPRPPGSPVPAELPLFAEALGPEEWIAYNGIPIPDGKIERRAVKRIFIKQLGRPWRGWKNLAPYRQVILATFCLKAARKRKEADDMLGHLSQMWTAKSGLKLSGGIVGKARKILRNQEISGETLAKCGQHAFENTAILRSLFTARAEGGVLSPSQFLWLRGYDRTLWYALNNLGRQTFHTEALGTMSHFRAEKQINRPVYKPHIDDAVDTIVNYTKSGAARPIPQLDYSKSKKKRSIKKIKAA